MKIIRKLTSIMLAALFLLMTTAGSASARTLTVTWAFLFPIPIPLPVWSVDHPDSVVTFGFLFPVWLPLPFYNYDDKGPRWDRAGVDIPAGTVVYVDGVDMGVAADFTDDSAFSALPDGMHTVELRHDGKTLYAYTFGVKSGEFATAK